MLEPSRYSKYKLEFRLYGRYDEIKCIVTPLLDAEEYTQLCDAYETALATGIQHIRVPMVNKHDRIYTSIKVQRVIEPIKVMEVYYIGSDANHR